MPTGIARVHRCRRYQQLLEQPVPDDHPNLLVGHALLREELSVGLLAELAVEALCAGEGQRSARRRGVLKGEAVLAAKASSALASMSAVRSWSKSPAIARIIGLGILLPDLREPPLHRTLMSRSLTRMDPTFAMVSALTPNPPPRMNALDIAHGEADEDEQKDDRHDGRADRRVRKAAEGSKH